MACIGQYAPEPKFPRWLSPALSGQPDDLAGPGPGPYARNHSSNSRARTGADPPSLVLRVMPESPKRAIGSRIVGCLAKRRSVLRRVSNRMAALLRQCGVVDDTIPDLVPIRQSAFIRRTDSSGAHSQKPSEKNDGVGHSQPRNLELPSPASQKLIPYELGKSLQGN